MRVRILKQTRWKHKPAWRGIELELPDDVAALWVERGIAEPLDIAEAPSGEPKRQRSRKTTEQEQQ